MVWWRDPAKGRGKRPVGVDVDADGFGQGLLDDAMFIWRFLRCRREPTTWRSPTEEEQRAHARHAVIGRFGDETFAVTDGPGQHWIVRERDFHGWPDAPRYAFFALQDGAIWAAPDFNTWPRAWQPPPKLA